MQTSFFQRDGDAVRVALCQSERADRALAIAATFIRCMLPSICSAED